MVGHLDLNVHQPDNVPERTTLYHENQVKQLHDSHEQRRNGGINTTDTTMTARPIILTPATPSELITTIIAHYRYPTTIIVASPKQPFLDALTQEVTSDAEREEDADQQLLRKTLLQTAVSRHIHILFTPTVTHLRALTSTFSQADSRVQDPPNFTKDGEKKPLLIVYCFLELHRSTTEWSAQGLGTSAAALVEAATRNGFRAAVVEPRGGGDGFEGMSEFLGERVPVLSGTARTVEVGRVLKRWFEEEVKS